MTKNKYIFKDKNGKERVVYALTYGEAMKQLRPKQNDLYELLETVYNVDIYTYNIKVIDVDFNTNYDVVEYDKEFTIDSPERLYHDNELRDKVIEYLTDTLEVEITDVTFHFEVD